MCAVSQRYSNRNVQVIIIIIRWHALQTAQLSPGLSAINISLGTHCHAERRPTLHWWTFSSTVRNPGDHSPDNVKFSDNSLTVRGTRYVKCYSYHARTSTKYLYGCKYAAYNKQFLATFPWQDLFPDSSLTFSKIPDSCQIPWYFQVFQTSSHPGNQICLDGLVRWCHSNGRLLMAARRSRLWSWDGLTWVIWPNKCSHLAGIVEVTGSWLVLRPACIRWVTNASSWIY